MKRPKLAYDWVRVRYHDITGLASWGEPSEIQPLEAYAEGWLVWETDEFIVIANSVIGGKEFGNRDAIPKGTVIELDRGRVKSAIHVDKSAGNNTDVGTC